MSFTAVATLRSSLRPVGRTGLAVAMLAALTLATPGYAQLAALPADDAPQAAPPTPDTTAPVVSRGDIDVEFIDIDARLARLPWANRAGFVNDPDRIEQMLQGLLLAKQLAAKARAEGMDKDPVLAAELQLIQDELLANRLMAQTLATAKVPVFKEAARERYVAQPDAFSTAEVVSVRHLLIRSDRHGEDKARELAQGYLAEARAPAGDFEALVRAHSEDKNAENTGGLIPTIVRGKTVGSFEEAAFALQQPGELSDVVKTRYGFHIIQLIEKTPSVRRPYEAVETEIMESLRQDYLASVRDKLLNQMREQPMEPHPDNILSLRYRYLPDGAGTAILARSPGANGASPAATDEPAAAVAE